MGNAAFWYRPTNAQTLIAVNLQGPPHGREGPHTSYDLSVSTSMGRTRAVRVYSGTERLVVKRTIQRPNGDTARSTDAAKAIRKLKAMVAHLRRGGMVSYTEDLTYMCAAFATNVPGYGATAIAVGPRLTSGIAPGVSFANREVVVRSDPDRLLLEEKLCTSFSNGSLVIDVGIVEDFAASRWILVRESGTYPALRLPEEALGRDDLFTSSDDFTWELNLPLEDSVDDLERFARTEADLGSELPTPSDVGLPPGDNNPLDHVVPYWY